MNLEIQNLLTTNFGEYLSHNEKANTFLHDHFELKEYAGREIIVSAGEQARYFYLVLCGVQAIYLINNKGEKVVLGFSFSGNISGVYDAFIQGKPSSLFLEAITTSKMIAIKKSDYDVFFSLFPEFYQWRTDFIESILFGRLNREVEIMTMPARNRFESFMQRCPEELMQIPQKYLASYLNMTPETFSRLRAERN